MTTCHTMQHLVRQARLCLGSNQKLALNLLLFQFLYRRRTSSMRIGSKPESATRNSLPLKLQWRTQLMIFGNLYSERIKYFWEFIIYGACVASVWGEKVSLSFSKDTKPEKIISLTQLGEGHCRSLGWIGNILTFKVKNKISFTKIKTVNDGDALITSNTILTISHLSQN